MTTRREGHAFAALLSLALLAGCGGGEQNSKDNAMPNNANNAENNGENNAKNNDENSGAGPTWSATVSGLDGTELALPADGFGGDSVANAITKLQLGSDADTTQILSIVSFETDTFRSTGEKTVSIILNWDKAPRSRCVSNLGTTGEATGAMINVTSVEPLAAEFEGELDCYVDTGTENPETTYDATISGELVGD